MRMMKYIFYIILPFLSITSLYSQASNFGITYYTSYHGLPHDNIKDILQDKDGFIWIATFNGLMRFDGTNFRSFSSGRDGNSLDGSRIISLYNDADGKVWVGSASRGLNCYNPQQHTFMHFKKDSTTLGLYGNRIVGIKEDEQKRLWVGTNWGVNRLNPNRDTVERLYTGRVTAVNKISKGVVVCVKGKTILYPNNSEDSIVLPQLNYPFYDVIEESENIIWLAGWNTGLIQYDLTKKKVIHQIKSSENNGLEVNNIYQILKDRKGRFWVGTLGGGLYLFNQNTGHFKRVTLLPPNSIDKSSKDYAHIIALMEDRKGNIWVGTGNSGVCKISADEQVFYSDMRLINNPNSLKEGMIRTFCKDNMGNEWIGLKGHGLTLKKDNKFQYDSYKKYTKSGKNNRSPEISAIYKDKSNRVWFGHKEGLSFISYKNNIPVFKNYYNSELGIVSILFQDKQGTIWVGTEEKGLQKITPIGDKLEITQYPYQSKTKGGLHSPWVTTIIEDDKNNLWVGTLGGLHRLDKSNNQFDVFRSLGKGTLSSNTINCVTQTKDGHIWVATVNGLNEAVYHQQTGELEIIRIYTQEDGLPKNEIKAIITDHHDNIWGSTDKGIFRYIKNENRFETFGKRDGVVTNIFARQSVFKDKKTHKIYFGGKNCLVSFNPDDVQYKKDNIKPAIVRLEVDNKNVLPRMNVNGEALLDKTIEYTDSVTFSYKHNSISFIFVGLEAESTDKVHYTYKMNGVDNDWQYAGKRTRATYTSLPREEELTFRVRVSSDGNQWGEEKQLHIYVTPPWWETKVFKAFVFILFAGFLFSAYKYRTYQLKKRQVELERLVDEKTEEICSQNEELIQQSEELQQQRDYLFTANEQITLKNEQITHKNELITSSIKYAKSIQKAILPTQAQCAASFSSSFIIYHPKDIVSGDFYWLVKEGQKTFFACVDCTGHGVPGALMSMIGTSTLNQLVKEKKLTSPKEILDHLDAKIRTILKQEAGSNDDGMDLSLCVLEPSGNQTKIVFAGAKNDLYICKNGEQKITAIKGSRKAIGGTLVSNKVFTEEELLLSNGDMIYLFTDGVLDICNDERKRFGKKRLLSVLEENADKDLNTQHQSLLSIIEDFKGKDGQRDDITVIGLKI